MYKHGDYDPLRPILNDRQLWKIVLPADWLCPSAKALPSRLAQRISRRTTPPHCGDPAALRPRQIRVNGYYTDALGPARVASSPDR